MISLLRLYKRLLQKHPTKVVAFQTGIPMGLADVLAQKAIEKKKFKDIDVQRSASFFVVGFCVVGPGLNFWYRCLDKYVGKGKTGTAVVMKKVLVDQVAFAPSFLAIFIVVLGVLQNKSLTYIKEKLEHDYHDILLANYKVWPAVQLVNFYLMPLQYQVLFVQVVALFWNTYLSWKTANPITKEKVVST